MGWIKKYIIELLLSCVVGMGTLIFSMLGLIYHDGHGAISSIAGQMESLTRRVETIEKTDATQTADISNIKWITQYGLIPKPIVPENYKAGK